jgi:hypothetical protein
MTKQFISIIVIIFSLFILIIVIASSLSNCSIFQPKKLPNDYKNYNSLNSLNTKNTILFGNYYLELMFKSSEPIEQALLPSNDLIVSTTSKKNDSAKIKHFFKLNKKGEIIDSISFIETFENGNEELLNNYLVNTKHKYFKTWPLDGKKTKINFILQNQDFNIGSTNEKKIIDQIFKNAQFRKVDYDFDYHFKSQDDALIKQNQSDTGKPVILKINKTVYIIVYLMNGQWYNFYTLTDISDRISSDELLSSRCSSNTLFKKYNTEDQKWKVISNTNIIYKYFHKIKTEKIIIPGGGGGFGSYYENYWWKGQLFSNLIINNDTLKIYDNLYLDEESIPTPIAINGKEIGSLHRDKSEPAQPLMFYSNKALGYSLFTNDEKKLYMIKQKDSIPSVKNLN